MKIPVEVLIRGGQDETTEAVRAYALRKLSFALRRFDDLVRHVTVRVFDVNGPRGGVDARCSVTAECLDGTRLFVDANAAYPFAAITQAAGRLGEAVRRVHERHVGRRADATTIVRAIGARDLRVS